MIDPIQQAIDALDIALSISVDKFRMEIIVNDSEHNYKLCHSIMRSEHERIGEALQALREYQENGGWISVDERLPKLKLSPGNLTATGSKEYLVATNEGYITLATWSQGISGGGWVKNNKDDINECVRYWKTKDKAPTNQERVRNEN